MDRLPLSYFDTHSSGDTLSRVTNDVDLIAQSLNQSLTQVGDIFRYSYWNFNHDADNQYSNDIISAMCVTYFNVFND